MNGDGASCRARGTSLGTTRAIRGRDALRFVAKRILWATFAGQLTTSICVRGKATEEENRGRKQRKNKNVFSASSKNASLSPSLLPWYRPTLHSLQTTSFAPNFPSSHVSQSVPPAVVVV